MRGATESEDEFHIRLKRAESRANESQGKLPGSTALWLVASFFAGSMPAYFCLLIAGFNPDRLQIPLACAGLALTGITYLLIWERQKLWHKAFTRQMDQSKPD